MTNSLTSPPPPSPLAIVVDVPPSEWLTSNMRLHWRARATRTKALRSRGRALARHGLIDVFPVRVVVEVINRSHRRFDPGNVAPAAKAIMDGFTDAGLWPDDDAAHVIGPDYRAGLPAPAMRPQWHRLILTITHEEA